MKKYKPIILLLLVSLMGITKSIACDICGAGIGSYYVGLLPDFNKRFIGLRYHHNTLLTHLGPQRNRTPITADETYQTIELWGAWNFGNRMRIMAILPYNSNSRHLYGSGESGYKDGLGDVIVTGHYKLFDHAATIASNNLLIHSLWIGGGVKIPTGQYDANDRNSVSQDAPNNFQLGTASTDFLINVAYDIRIMDLGLNINTSYKINTENKHEYRYGNKFSMTALAYYKFNIRNKIRISPNAGTIYETQLKDKTFRQYTVAQSGGNSLNAAVGIEVNTGSISFGGSFQTPIHQHIADGRAKALNRILTHISYTF